MSYKLYKREKSKYYQAYISVKVGNETRTIRISTGQSGRDKALEVARQTESDLLAANGEGEIGIKNAFGEFYERESARYTAPRNLYYTLRQMSAFFGGDKPFSSLTNADINNYIYAMQQAGKAAGTINRHLVVLSSVITACRRKWSYRAPDVRPLEFKQREPDGRIGLVNNDDRLAIMANAAPHLRLCMEIAYYTGLRRGNIFTLRWEQIDFENNTITVNIKDSTVAGGRIHTVMMPPALVKLLNELPRDSEYVVTYKGEPIKEIKTAWAAACRRAGIPPHKYRFHDVRHGSATAVVRSTQSLYAAQLHLGHKTPKMTQRYAKFLDEDRQRIAKQVFG